MGKLQDGALNTMKQKHRTEDKNGAGERIVYLAILPVGQNTHIVWVLNGCNYSSSKQNFLPRLAEVENWYTYTSTEEQYTQHVAHKLLVPSDLVL